MKEEDAIEKFLNKRLVTSPNTRRLYRTCIEKYFDLIGKDENEYFNNGMTNDDYEADLNKVYLHFEKIKKGYLARRTYFTPVKQFMITNKKELKELEFWGILKARTKGAEPESDETIMNVSEIKNILSHGDACARAMFLMLASSGRRIGELLALTLEDVNIDVTPATIKVKKGLVGKEINAPTKTKQTTVCFISEEAKQAYITWLKERPRYLERACKISKYDKDANDPRVFPMTYDNAKTKWETLLVRSGQGVKNNDGKIVPKRDAKTHNLVTHPHALRKFFRSYLGDADLAEYLMGHATILTRTYRQLKPEDLAAKYLKYMPNVTILENPVDLTGINESLKEKDAEITQLKETAKLQEMRLDIMALKLESMTNGKK